MITTSARYKGFTLIELLTVITIIGLLMAGAVATFVNVGRATQLEGAARAIKNKIVYARTTGITRARKIAIRITLTPNTKKWKIDTIDSIDNRFDNDDDKILDKPYYLPKQIMLEKEMEIEFSPEGSITYSTENPIVLKDLSKKDDIWTIPITLYKAAGQARVGEITKPIVQTAEKTNVTSETEKSATESALDDQFFNE